MGKITLEGNHFERVGTAISVPDSEQLNLSATNNKFVDVGKALDVRDAELPEDLKKLLTELPAGVTAEQIAAALSEIRDAEPDEGSRTAALKRTSLWDAIKDKGPELTAFVINTAIEVFKGRS